MQAGRDMCVISHGAPLDFRSRVGGPRCSAQDRDTPIHCRSVSSSAEAKSASGAAAESWDGSASLVRFIVYEYAPLDPADVYPSSGSATFGAL